MTMHTEKYCESMENLDPVKAIRAIHQAHLQIAALNRAIDCGSFDNTPVLTALCECLRDAGYAGFAS